MTIYWLEPYDLFGTSINNVTSYLGASSSLNGFALVSGRISPSRALRISPGFNTSIVYPNDAAFTTKATGCLSYSLNPSFAALTGKQILVQFTDGTTAQLTFATDSTGKIYCYRGTTAGTLLFTSTNSLTSAVYKRIEFKVTIHPSAGVIEVKVDESSVGWIPQQTGLNTRNSANSYFDRITIASSTGVSGGQFDIDDMVFSDDFLGDLQLSTQYPTANGASNQWTPTGEAQNYLCLDNNPPNDAIYSGDSTVGHEQLVTYPAVSGTVLAAAFVAREFKNTAGARSTETVNKSGATTTVDAGVALSTTPLHRPRIYETDPNTGSAWTDTNLNACSWGKRTAA